MGGGRGTVSSNEVRPYREVHDLRRSPAASVWVPETRFGFGTLQLELLDEHRWDTRDQLANAIFD